MFKEQIEKYKAKFKNVQWCTVLNFLLTTSFLGGGQHYLSEFQKTRDTIVEQADRIEKIAENLKTTVEQSASTVTSTVSSSANKIEDTGDNINKGLNDLEGIMKKVKKACRF